MTTRGRPTTDPSVRFREPQGTLLPMGGEQGYKGFGLGLLFDVMVGGLSGGQCPPARESDRLTNNVLLVVWDPARFSGQSHFTTQADQLMDYVRSCSLISPVESIRLPNDRSLRTIRERTTQGIPLDVGNLVDAWGTGRADKCERPTLGRIDRLATQLLPVQAEHQCIQTTANAQ